MIVPPSTTHFLVPDITDNFNAATHSETGHSSTVYCTCQMGDSLRHYPTSNSVLRKAHQGRVNWILYVHREIFHGSKSRHISLDAEREAHRHRAR
jgi:hypothetical protein